MRESHKMFIQTRSLTIVLLFVLMATVSHAAPRASQGRLDLTDWNFSIDGTTSLDGQWEFYPGTFLAPDSLETLAATQSPRFVSVPGAWNAYPDETGAPMGSDGFATYRLHVQLPSESEEISIYVPYVNTSYQLWIDGELLAANGTVGRTSTETRPQFKPQIVSFQPKNRYVDIVFHIANFDFRNGGIPRSLRLGATEQITLMQKRSEIIGATLFGASLIMAFFFGCIYTMHREDFADAFFSLFLFFIAVRMLVTGHQLLARITTELPWEIILKIEYISGYLSPTLFLYYLRAIFPKEVSKHVVNIWTGVAVTGTFIALLLPGRLSSQVIPIYLIFVAMISLYFVYIGFLAVIRNRPDARLFAGGMVILIVLSLLTLPRYAGIAETGELIPIGIVVLIATQGLILAKRWVRAYHQTVSLAAENARMLEQTEWQLEKLKEYRRLMTLREENLRRRIAEMLHGRTQSRLFSATRRIDQARTTMTTDTVKANELLADAKGLLNQVREDDIRSTGKQLHPTAVGAGLIAAIESLLDSFEDSYQVRFHVDHHVEMLDQSQGGLPYDLRLGIYRIVEEGLNNISKHANAQSIRVLLTLDQKDERPHLKLTLSDDGVGFDPDRPSNGLGLPTIDARVGDLKGTWTFTGSPGNGTDLTVFIPLKQPKETG